MSFAIQNQSLIIVNSWNTAEKQLLINDGKKLQSDFSVLNYTRDNKMILITADVENKHGCEEND